MVLRFKPLSFIINRIRSIIKHKQAGIPLWGTSLLVMLFSLLHLPADDTSRRLRHLEFRIPHARALLLGQQ